VVIFKVFLGAQASRLHDRTIIQAGCLHDMRTMQAGYLHDMRTMQAGCLRSQKKTTSFYRHKEL